MKLLMTIKGKNNTGKTSLVKYTYKNLVSDGGEVLWYNCKDFMNVDFFAVVMWHGLKIALNSIGDGITWIREGLNKAAECNVDVMINTSSIPEDKYKECIPISEFPISMDFLKDEEERLRQKQLKYYKEILPELMKLV